MGRTHATAYKSVTNVFGDEYVPELIAVADVNAENAKALAEKYGFQRWTTDWHDVVADPEIDMVDITTPNASTARSRWKLQSMARTCTVKSPSP